MDISSGCKPFGLASQAGAVRRHFPDAPVRTNEPADAGAHATEVSFSAKAMAFAQLATDGSRFSSVADRFDPVMVAAFNDNDRKLLGEAFRLAMQGGEDDVRKIDKLAAELGALRIEQQFTGKLIRSVTRELSDRNDDGRVNSDDVVYQLDPAHVAIVGEMLHMVARQHEVIHLFD